MIWTSPAGAKPGATIINTDARTTVAVFHANKQVVVSSHEVAVEVTEPNQFLRPLQRAWEHCVARLGERSHSGAGIRDDPSDGDTSWKSQDNLSQEGACLVCNQDVAGDEWYADIHILLQGMSSSRWFTIRPKI